MTHTPLMPLGHLRKDSGLNRARDVTAAGILAMATKNQQDRVVQQPTQKAL